MTEWIRKWIPSTFINTEGWGERMQLMIQKNFLLWQTKKYRKMFIFCSCLSAQMDLLPMAFRLSDYRWCWQYGFNVHFSFGKMPRAIWDWLVYGFLIILISCITPQMILENYKIGRLLCMTFYGMRSLQFLYTEDKIPSTFLK